MKQILLKNVGVRGNPLSVERVGLNSFAPLTPDSVEV
jgi:hypothetical protein